VDGQEEVMVWVNILGTRYLIEKKRIEDDPLLGEQSLGYTDESIKRIVVACMTKDICELKDTSFVTREVIRHEIIHAFLIESGLGDLMIHVESGHDEQMIDWFARQSDKIFKAFEEVGVLNKGEKDLMCCKDCIGNISVHAYESEIS
jgi:hypothetical protein